MENRETVDLRKEYWDHLLATARASSYRELAILLDVSESTIYKLTSTGKTVSNKLAAVLYTKFPHLDHSIVLERPSQRTGETRSLGTTSFEIQNDVTKALLEIKHSIHENVSATLSSMKNGDYHVVFAMDQVPLELSSQGIKASTDMAKALKAGAHFLYLVPRRMRLGIAQGKKQTIGDRPADQNYSSVVKYDYSLVNGDNTRESHSLTAFDWISTLHLDRDLLQVDCLIKMLGSRIRELIDASPDEIDRWISEQVHVLPLDSCPYFVPGFRFALLLSRSIPSRNAAFSVFNAGNDLDSKIVLCLPLSGCDTNSMTLMLIQKGSGILDIEIRRLESLTRSSPESAPRCEIFEERLKRLKRLRIVLKDMQDIFKEQLD